MRFSLEWSRSTALRFRMIANQNRSLDFATSTLSDHLIGRHTGTGSINQCDKPPNGTGNCRVLIGIVIYGI